MILWLWHLPFSIDKNLIFDILFSCQTYNLIIQLGKSFIFNICFREEYENEKNLPINKNAADSSKNGYNKVSSNTELLEDRIAHVTNSLEALEMGMVRKIL